MKLLLVGAIADVGLLYVRPISAQNVDNSAPSITLRFSGFLVNDFMFMVSRSHLEIHINILG